MQTRDALSPAFAGSEFNRQCSQGASAPRAGTLGFMLPLAFAG